MRSIVAIAALAFTTSCFAQFSAPAELDALSWTVGEWESTFDMAMMGQTTPVKGYMEIKRLPMFYKYTAWFDFGGFKMDEEMFLGWDTAKSRYTLHAFANTGSDPRIEYGTFKDGKLSMIAEPWGPAQTVARSVLWAAPEGKLRFTLEMQEGTKWVPSMDSTWTKVKKASAAKR